MEISKTFSVMGNISLLVVQRDFSRHEAIIASLNTRIWKTLWVYVKRRGYWEQGYLILFIQNVPLPKSTPHTSDLLTHGGRYSVISCSIVLQMAYYSMEIRCSFLQDYIHTQNFSVFT